MRVLLIEDNPGDVRLVREAARGLGLELDAVGTLADALDRVRAIAYDIVLTDLGLPDGQGTEAVVKLRAAAPDLPIVVLTGSVDDTQALPVLRAGADDYLAKGHIDGYVLGRALRYAAERKQFTRRAAEALHDEARTADTLHRIGRLLTSDLDLESVVQVVTDEATTLTGADFGAFFYNVVSESGGSYMLYTLSGAQREAFEGFPMPRNTPVFAPTFHGEGAVRSDDITTDPRYGRMSPHHGMPEGHLPVRSYLAVPVVSRTGTVLGGLFFGAERVGLFTDRHERLVVGIAAWAAVAMDNAQLYEAERHAREEAETANRVKSDFLATMSHELRTPLNAMIGYTDLWLMDLPAALPAAIRDQVERVRLSAKHLLQLIEEILTFSRLEAAQETVEVADVPVSTLIESTAALVEPLALGKGLRFEVEAPADSVIVRTDGRKLRQILVNLLSNAVKFTQRGTITLAARLEAGAVVFVARDTGEGIDAADLERIFEPFYQARSGSVDRPAGTGLGLAVSRRLARLLGGDLTVESHAGAGSEFTVRLPLEAPEPAGVGD